MEELLRIQLTSLNLKDAERSGEVEDRLSLNKQNLESEGMYVPAGTDKCLTILHLTRFLAGAACSTNKFWLTAKENIEACGHNPVANNNMF